MTVTVAPGIARACGSVIVPVMEPVDCAAAAAATARRL